jgi:hypothetical protein
VSLEKFVKKIEIELYNPTEEDLCDMLTIALHHFDKPNPITKRIPRWNSCAVTNMLIMRYGLRGNREHTLQSLGEINNLSRERIMQVEAKAFVAIRKYLIESGT